MRAHFAVGSGLSRTCTAVAARLCPADVSSGVDVHACSIGPVLSQNRRLSTVLPRQSLKMRGVAPERAKAARWYVGLTATNGKRHRVAAGAGLPSSLCRRCLNSANSQDGWKRRVAKTRAGPHKRLLFALLNVHVVPASCADGARRAPQSALKLPPGSSRKRHDASHRPQFRIRNLSLSCERLHGCRY